MKEVISLQTADAMWELRVQMVAICAQNVPSEPSKVSRDRRIAKPVLQTQVHLLPAHSAPVSQDTSATPAVAVQPVRQAHTRVLQDCQHAWRATRVHTRILLGLARAFRAPRIPAPRLAATKLQIVSATPIFSAQTASAPHVLLTRAPSREVWKWRHVVAMSDSLVSMVASALFALREHGKTWQDLKSVHCATLASFRRHLELCRSPLAAIVTLAHMQALPDQIRSLRA
mmetsp:Transcript_102253/g.164813  ORF Transcript_102253/g.164813 Transcript_102253/m.164813 type:complete len:229 (-) Transcript_102253:2550-3236(-)